MPPDPGDDFTANVLAVVADLPPGVLATYGEVAMEAGRPGAARAVGRVLARRGADVPWWRVVPASGRLAPALAERQAAALRAEGIVVVDGRIAPETGPRGGTVAPGGPTTARTLPMPHAAGVLHHLELYVRDLEVSAEFWGWLLAQLRYEPLDEWDEGISWRPADQEQGSLALVLAPDGARDLDRRSVGLNHVAFAVASPEAVDALTAGLQERGVRILYPDRHPYAGGRDHYAVFFEDPDGLKVEVVAADGSS